jgi:ankyrin repeat protein
MAAKRNKVIVGLLDSLRKWIEEEEISNPHQEEIKQDWIQFFSFSPPNSFLSLLSKLPPDYGLSIGYELQFIEHRDAMRRSFCYSECFQEFYRLTELIPILDYGSGRNFDLYDCKTGAIIQFNVIDSPLEWIVLADSFEEVVKHFYQILQNAKKQKIPLPDSIYSSFHGNDESSFKSLLERFPDRANELNEILPRPLVLRTHQPGTWQIDKPCRIHEIIQNSVTDEITDLQTYLDAYPNDIRQKSSQKSEPLHEVCRLGRVNCLKFLIQRIQETSGVDGLKAALAARDASQLTPLLAACQEIYRRDLKLAQCIDFLLSLGSEVIDVDCSQDEGQTPLHLLAAASSPYFVKRLIQLGANVHQRNKEQYGGDTPLHSLCRTRGGAQDDARALARSGGTGVGAEASAPDRVLSFSIDHSSSFDLTERSSILTLLLLIDAGADVNAVTLSNNSTPLHLLMWGSGMENNSQMVEILCKSGADVNATTSGPFGLGQTVLGSGFAREKYFDILSRYGVLEEREPKRRMVTHSFTQVITSRSGTETAAPVLKTSNAIMGMTASEAIAAVGTVSQQEE